MSRTIVTDKGIRCVMRKRKGMRSMKLSVSGSGEVTLTLPRFVPFAAGEKFLLERTEWIREQLSRFLSQPKRFLPKGSTEEYAARKAEARALVLSRLEMLNVRYGFSWDRVSIRNQKTRWGSCSRKGNLSFSYRLLFLPERLRDYVIVHELCHLREFNHSPDFWALVSQTFPDYRELRARLRGW